MNFKGVLQVHLWPETALELKEEHLGFFYNSKQVGEFTGTKDIQFIMFH